MADQFPRPYGYGAITQIAGWADAVSNLREQWQRERRRAESRADAIGTSYAGRRGSMVVDVITSRRQRYDDIVQPKILAWERNVEAAGDQPSLRYAAENRNTSPPFPLRSGEMDAVQAVAEGLLRFGRERNLDDDGACLAWAAATEGLELAAKLDPYVGSVKGIGQALFAYCRILSGADSIKPDDRIIKRLRELGMSPPVGDALAGFVLSACLAHELRIRLVDLDQLLWNPVEDD